MVVRLRLVVSELVPSSGFGELPLRAVLYRWTWVDLSDVRRRPLDEAARLLPGRHDPVSKAGVAEFISGLILWIPTLRQCFLVTEVIPQTAVLVD